MFTLNNTILFMSFRIGNSMSNTICGKKISKGSVLTPQSIWIALILESSHSSTWALKLTKVCKASDLFLRRKIHVS